MDLGMDMVESEGGLQCECSRKWEGSSSRKKETVELGFVKRGEKEEGEKV